MTRMISAKEESFHCLVDYQVKRSLVSQVTLREKGHDFNPRFILSDRIKETKPFG